MKPPFSYYGGKQKMASNIVPLIPKHTVYVEPFCGAGTILFAKPMPEITYAGLYIEYLNDNNLNIYNFFEQLKNNGEELCRQLELSLYHEYSYKISKTDKSFVASSIEDAVKFFINISQSFGHKYNGGWGRSVFNTSHVNSFFNRVKLLPIFIERVRRITFSCNDALLTIKQFDSPQTFFYVDPPYPKTHQGHYDGYTQDDFNKLVDVLQNIQGSFLLSCYGNDRCDRLFEKFSFDAVCSVRGRVGYDRSIEKDESDQNRKRTEVVYRKFSNIPREEIKKLYASGKYDCYVKHPWEDIDTIDK